MGRHRKRSPWPRRVFRALTVATALGAVGVASYGLAFAPVPRPSADAPPITYAPAPSASPEPTAPAPATTAAPTTTAPAPGPPSPAPKPPPPPPAPRACTPLKLGGVRPAVGRVAASVQQRFGLPLSGLLGVGFRSGPSDHPAGRAVDFMVGTNRALGDRIAQYLLDHRTEFGISYLIWRQRINFGSGWSGMPDRGSVTANHHNHVHASFSPNATGAVTC